MGYVYSYISLWDPENSQFSPGRKSRNSKSHNIYSFTISSNRI